MHKILVPRLNNNEDSYTLAQWLAESGQVVTAEQAVAVVESSKTSVELSCERAGVLHCALETGDTCACGDIAAYVFANETERQAFLAGWRPERPATNGACTITRAARELMDRHGIAEEQVLELGKSLVRGSDIEALLARHDAPATSNGGAPATLLPLTRRQAAIAEVVSRSYATIPRAFVAMRVYCDTALAALAELSASEDRLLGLTELLVKVVAGLHGQFPLCFGALVDRRQFAPAASANIGVTFDCGHGLFIPVVHDAAALSLGAIADLLMDYRVKAFRDSFGDEDLAGGSFSISLNTEQDTVFVLPIILPDQTCMLTLSATQDELFLTAAQTVATRRYVTLGLAYDHRVINGSEAVQFVKAIKAQVESPDLTGGGAAR